MFGVFVVEVLSGRKPWWWLPFDADLLSYRQSTPTSCPLTEAFDGDVPRLVLRDCVIAPDTNPASLGDLLVLVRECLNPDPALRPLADTLSSTLREMRDTLLTTGKSRTRTTW